MNLYSLENLNSGYDDRCVLKDLTLSIGPGEFVSVIGPNGAGKSTLIKLMAGNMQPLAGKCIFLEKPVNSYSEREFARKVSVVHQFIENLLPFSVLEFIRMGRFPHQGLLDTGTPDDNRIVEESIEITGILHLLNRPLTQLSGGELQLVQIARALAQASEVILLDEPVSHLDIHHAIKIMDVLFELNRRGTTIIIVLHDINLAADYSSRIIALKDGNLFDDGKPEKVITYESIEKLFDTLCIVIPNPTTKRPHTIPIPGHNTDKKNSGNNDKY